jgi:hypothetical protein
LPPIEKSQSSEAMFGQNLQRRRRGFGTRTIA